MITLPEGPRHVQQPVPELAQRRGEHWHWQDQPISPGTNLLDGIQGETFEIIVECEAGVDSPADRAGIRVRTSSMDATTIGFTPKRPGIFVDRAISGQVDFNPDFPRVHVALLTPVDGRVRLHIFVDRTSVEVFANGRQTVLADQIFPAVDDQDLVDIQGDQIDLPGYLPDPDRQRCPSDYNPACVKSIHAGDHRRYRGSAIVGRMRWGHLVAQTLIAEMHWDISTLH